VSPDLEKYYDARLSMFDTKGWADLVEDVKAMEKTVDTLDGVTPENVDFKQGELSIIKWILNLQQQTLETMEELNADV
tara:strand:+ start:2505 stop:2738 length:234 start_codon:yes stop_codon:yes gene_type:complete